MTLLAKAFTRCSGSLTQILATPARNSASDYFACFRRKQSFSLSSQMEHKVLYFGTHVAIANSINVLDWISFVR